MKKFLLLLTIFFSAFGLANAADTTETSTFTDKYGAVDEGQLGWTFSKAASSFDANYGMQFGSGKKGVLTITSNSTIDNVKKVEIVISSNTTGNRLASIEVQPETGDKTIQSNNIAITRTNNTTYGEEFTSPYPSGTIKITVNIGYITLWVKSITVTYGDGSAELVDPAITWTLDSEALTEGAEVSAILGSESNTFPTLSYAEGATVTCVSSCQDVATVDNNGNVTIIAAGETIITASTPADDASFLQASKSYKLIVDPTTTDIFGFEQLSFSMVDEYCSFTYVSEATGTQYAGYSYPLNENKNIQVKRTDNNGIYISKVPNKLKISKIVITTSNSYPKTEIIVYGNSEAFEATGQSGTVLGKLAGDGTLTIDFHDSTNEAIYGKACNAFCVNANSANTCFISTVRVVWEPIQPGEIVQDSDLAYLVTDASTLQPGDIIIIANQESAKAMSNQNSDNSLQATAATFSEGASEITTIPHDALLLQLVRSEGYWSFKTTNYLGTSGYLASQNTGNDYLQVIPSVTDYALATISICDGVAAIKFNKGADTNHNNLRFDSTGDIFSCYADGKEDVSIYRLTDKPSTVGVQATDYTFAAKGEDETVNVIELQNKFETTTTAENVAIYLDNIMIDIFPVEAGKVNADINYIPYLPTAQFSVRPVLASDSEGNPTQVGPAEALDFTWPALDSEAYGFTLTNELILCYNSDSTVGPWIFYGYFSFLDNFEKGNLDYKVSVRAVNNDDPSVEYTDGEPIWENGEFHILIPDYFTTNVWGSNGAPDISGCTVPVVKFLITPTYEITYNTKYSTLVTGAASVGRGLQAETAVQSVKSAPHVAVSTITSDANVITGVEGVTTDGEVAVEYYNLQGVRVGGDLAPGIYIRRQGYSVNKIQIR